MGVLYVSLAESQRRRDEPEFGDGVVLMFVVLWHLLVIAVLVLIVLPVQAVLALRRRHKNRRAAAAQPEPEKEVWRYGY